jgi:hypothetical protein
MALGDVWKTKLLIDVTVEASSKLRAQGRLENALEKIKYQTPHVKLDVTIEPNWKLVEEDNANDGD